MYLGYFENFNGAIIYPGDYINDQGEQRRVEYIYKSGGEVTLHFEDGLVDLDAYKITSDQISLEPEVN